MIATAIGPQKIVNAIGISSKHSRDGSQHDGTKARHAGINHGLPNRLPLAAFGLDLFDRTPAVTTMSSGSRP